MTDATGWHLAQINIARLVAPEGDPRVAPFFAALARINALADRSPGFVWRLQTEEGNATAIQPAPDPLLLVNISVWTDPDSLHAYVYQSAHAPEMARRREYFERFDGAYHALWWVPAGHRPPIEEGLAKLWVLDRYGPSAKAFHFKTRFPAPE
ncbi:DUF3291 domain-containing protein [Novosphingobium piscinae]|uniref:DUF3291 domain-containing protein n=1 Tax=Novosphingobium piscinae TaxID=1507448 RepID=A0A7X1G085_9SPHN|nr:DUF3291 domain-containing protein [Novosphingobium piscinae]MBC2670225.1 DUF3291 domain-containing protein [Novosphingobium piscinae]